MRTKKENDMSKNELIEMVMKDDRLSQGAKDLYLALLTLKDNGVDRVEFEDGRVMLLGESTDGQIIN